MNFLNHISTVDRFYPYSSAFVSSVIVQFKRDDYDLLKSDIIRLLNAKSEHELPNIPHKLVGFGNNYCRFSWDNKICFRLKTIDKFCYISFYDGTVKIGLDIVKNNYDPKTYYVSINK